MEAWTGQEGLWLLFVCPEVELNCLYSFANELKLLSHGLLQSGLVCLHAVQLTCVLDMCNTFTKHNGSGQVVRVGAAAPQVF